MDGSGDSGGGGGGEGPPINPDFFDCDKLFPTAEWNERKQTKGWDAISSFTVGAVGSMSRIWMKGQ